MKKNKLICLTPVKNEAWCLDAFLTCTSLWADYIIIADQMSTDGSREIAIKYPKVILIDNNRSDLVEVEMRRLLFKEAEKITGDKVLLSLDADEIFSANFSETEDWQKIVNAEKGDVFHFKWANINPDQKTFFDTGYPTQFAFFDDGTRLERGSYIHSVRVPWPKNSIPRDIIIKDFYTIHLANLHTERTKSKIKYYQCLTLNNEPKYSIVTLFRTYNTKKTKPIKGYSIPSYFTKNYLINDINIFKLLNIKDELFWQDERIIKFFEQKGIKYYQGLDIFDEKWLKKLSSHSNTKFSDPRNKLIKLLHNYLILTTPYKSSFFVRVIDKILKKIFIF